MRAVLSCAAVLMLAAVPVARADFEPWFANRVGNATQVLAVTGTGGSNAKMDAWERTGNGWTAVAAGIPAKIGANGLSADSNEGSMSTPTGVFTLDYAFGTKPNPGSGMRYVQVSSNHWWDGDSSSPTYNTMQVCEKSRCPFQTGPPSGTENLNIAPYAHAVVMGVNPQRTPGKGSAFFLHGTDGGPTAGCVAIDDATLVKLMGWLKPGAMIAITSAT
ncbi:L,D-transpeptidase family protein [Mycolicibacterium insubricum]|uniref:L,D-TPase catalytic domain-containing protein n=1 Tax=Mycolicibacterium insubricum TaxID=444597 RepID=A0A1X0DEZ3_9MYCO|nr:L,D-transpeptidase family protein [Mycolicibacterium insubricum]ORA70953.1 hypothetical protein BST26_09500 [Mycolicibacterium insubricum]